LGYTDETRMVAAWCELRDDFRHFRTDRIASLTVQDDRFATPVATLRRRWEARMREQAAARRATARPE